MAAELASERNHDKEHGHHQSPIDIDLKCCTHDPALTVVNFDNNPHDCVEVTNKGTTWSIRIKDGANTKLSGPHLPGTYRLAEVHAHWGCKCDDGSEHFVGHKGYASEIHMVHYNDKYEFVDAAKRHGDGLAVLGILLQESDTDNPALEPLIHALKHIPYKGQIAQFQNGFDLAKLLPSNKEFCTYCGSLTTPPYTECVVWTVFVHPVPISHKQLEIFRSLYAHEHGQADQYVKIINNARACQPLGDRRVKSNFRACS